MSKKKHYKAPNGYGSCYKVKGHRLKPYRAVVTVDRDIVGGKAKQVRKTLGYYETENEAMSALLDYRVRKYDIGNTKMTFAEVYERWSEEHFPTIVQKSQNTLKNAYRHVPALHQMKMNEIRTGHLELAVRGAKAGIPTKKKITQLISMIFDWAMAHDVVMKDYSSLCNYRLGEEEPVIKRVLFTNEEIADMRKKIGDQLNDMVLFSIYTGVRPGELVTIRTENVDMAQRIIVGGIKTDFGKDRVIPIHKDITGLVGLYLSKNHEYLFTSLKIKGRKFPYATYRDMLTRTYKGHTCYDTRHTFSTAWKKQELNQYILKRIMGHKETDVTEKFYTHRDIENIRSEMDKLVL